MTNSNSTERFIAAAVRPLADNAEMQMMAAQELRDAFSRRKIETGRAEALAERLERTPGNKRRRWWLYGVVALVSVLALGLGIRDQRRWESASYVLFGMSDPILGDLPHLPIPRAAVMAEADLFGDFRPEQEELLFGARNSPGGREYERLSRRYPEDPAIFAEHAKRLSAWEPLPGNFIGAADRIDPDNGWFRYFAAGCAARKAVDSLRHRKSIRYRVKDPALLDEALKLAREAAEKPRFDSYRDEILLRRLALLPPGDDILGRLFVQEYAWSDGGKDHFVHRALGDAIGAKAEQLAAAGETEEFRKLSKVQEILARRVIENAQSTTLDSLWASVVLNSPSPVTMSKAAKDLGLEEEDHHYQQIEKKHEEVKNRRQGRRTEEFGVRSNIVAKRIRSDGFSARPLDFEELKPGLRAEHALLDRFLSYGGWLVFLVASGLAAFCRFRHGRQARLLSLSLLRALRTRDHLWIIGTGIALPFCGYVAGEHVPSITGADRNILTTLAGSGLRFSAAITLMLSLPVALAPWRLGRLFGRLPKHRWSWLGKVALVAALAAWVGGGVMEHPAGKLRSAEIFQACMIAVGACLAYHFLAGLLGLMLRRREEILRGLMLSRAVIPAYACGMLLMAGASFLFHAEEKAWIARNTFTKIDPAVPSASRFDHETAMQIRADSLEILATPEQ